MNKKISFIVLAVSILSMLCFNVVSAESQIEFKNKQTYLYPIFSNTPTEYTSSSHVDNVVPLGVDENTITVTFKDADGSDIYFVSIYDVTDGKYITYESGVAVCPDKFTVTGLIGGHDYTVKTSTFFEERTISGEITTSYIDIGRKEND